MSLFFMPLSSVALTKTGCGVPAPSLRLTSSNTSGCGLGSSCMHSGAGSGFVTSSSSAPFASKYRGSEASSETSGPPPRHKQYTVFPPSFSLVIFRGPEALSIAGSRLLAEASPSSLMSSHLGNLLPTDRATTALGVSSISVKYTESDKCASHTSNGLSDAATVTFFPAQIALRH